MEIKFGCCEKKAGEVNEIDEADSVEAGDCDEGGENELGMSGGPQRLEILDAAPEKQDEPETSLSEVSEA